MPRNNSVELRDVNGNHKRWLTEEEGEAHLKTERYNCYMETIRGKERYILAPKTNPREISGTIAMLGEHEMRANSGLGSERSVINVRAKVKAWPHIIDERAPMFAAGRPSAVVKMSQERIAEIDRGQIGYA